MANFNLPNEIWCKIFSYLSFEPKKNATATCKLWFRLIREDPKLSGYVLISCYNMEKALKTLEWHWSNWPALKTLELNNLEVVEFSRESIQNVIESLKDHCPSSFEAVLFNVDLTVIQTNALYNWHCYDQSLKVSKFQNEFMKSLFLPKYEPKIVRISAPVVWHS